MSLECENIRGIHITGPAKEFNPFRVFASSIINEAGDEMTFDEILENETEPMTVIMKENWCLDRVDPDDDGIVSDEYVLSDDICMDVYPKGLPKVRVDVEYTEKYRCLSIGYYKEDSRTKKEKLSNLIDFYNKMKKEYPDYTVTLN